LSDGLRLRSEAGRWDLHLGGRYVGHERVLYMQPEESGYRTRQALIRLDGTALEALSLRVAGDFTPVNGEPAARFHEVYLRWMPRPECGLTFGFVEMPAGLDRVLPLLFTEGIERPITASFQAGEEPGMLASGTVAGGLFTYDAAVSDGRSNIAHSST